jgi:hypothetical protein
MRRLRAASLMALFSAGCVSGPMLENPMRVPGEAAQVKDEDGSEVFLNRPPGEAYSALFDAALDAMDDFFPIAYANRYEGRILGKATFAPGIEQPWKPGSPDLYQRLLVTFQAYRYRAEIRFREAEPAGYFVQVIVYKELKDYPTTSGSILAVPVLGEAGTLDRDQFVIIDPDLTSPIVTPGDRWIPKGRETAIEQKIIRKLQKSQ